jgi:hypothetical protein
MKATLDNKLLFDDGFKIDIGGFSHESKERRISGLSGAVSIDLGKKSRAIKQTGKLRAKSRLAMEKRISDIETFVDGGTHTLILANGQQLENLRMDSFKTKTEKLSGTGVVIEYEINYTQLMV